MDEGRDSVRTKKLGGRRQCFNQEDGGGRKKYLNEDEEGRREERGARTEKLGVRRDIA